MDSGYSWVYVNEPWYPNDPHACSFAWRKCSVSPEGPKSGICKNLSLAFSSLNVADDKRNVKENTKSGKTDSQENYQKNLFEPIAKKLKTDNIINNCFKKRHNENLLAKTIVKKIKLDHIYNFPNKYNATITKKRYNENAPDEIVVKKIKLNN